MAELQPTAAVGMRIPDFFIVGQAKSGTTALYEMLRRHPALFMPDLKEPEYLAEDMSRRFRPPMAGPLPATLMEYLALFAEAAADQRAGEASAFYLSSRTAAAAIAKLNPDARVIAVFREPASFLRSLHLQLVQNHIEDQRDLRRALALEPERRVGKRIPRRSYRPQVLQYTQQTHYTEQLERYHAVFPSEQVLVLIYEELRADNAATLRQILRFLGVDEYLPVAAVNANPSVLLRSQVLDDAVHRFSVGRGPYSNAVRVTAKALLPRGARRRLLDAAQVHLLQAAPPPIDAQLVSELRVRLRPEVERLGDYLGRDLVSLWGYDDQ